MIAIDSHPVVSCGFGMQHDFLVLISPEQIFRSTYSRPDGIQFTTTAVIGACVISRSNQVEVVMKAKQTDTEVAVEQAQRWADEQKEIAELISERFSRAEAR
jgi:hypothetical protein